MFASFIAAALMVAPLLGQDNPEKRSPQPQEPAAPQEAAAPQETAPPSEAPTKPKRKKKTIEAAPAEENDSANALGSAAEPKDVVPKTRPPRDAVTEQDRLSAQNQAKIFFANVILADARAIADEAVLPFYLESREIVSRDELALEWSRNLKGKRTDLFTLYNIEILSPVEMEKKYGKPPSRLKAFPWKAPRTLIAVANLSGHAAIAILTKIRDHWRVTGFTD
jgi:hypothetical protein